jgi:hypothetical protein
MVLSSILLVGCSGGAGSSINPFESPSPSGVVKKVLNACNAGEYSKAKELCAVSLQKLIDGDIGILNLDLGEVEKYFPELANYGMWWIKRYLTEKTDAGSIPYHGIMTGSASDVANFATRAVAAFEHDTIEKARKTTADLSNK